MDRDDVCYIDIRWSGKQYEVYYFDFKRDELFRKTLYSVSNYDVFAFRRIYKNLISITNYTTGY